MKAKQARGGIRAVVLTLTAGICVCLMEGRAPAREFQISAGPAYRWFFTGEADPVFEERNMTSLGVRLGGEIIENLMLELEYCKRAGTTEAGLFGDYLTRLDSYWATAAVKYSIDILKFLNGFARGGGGLTFADYSVTAMGRKYSDFDYSTHFYAGIGFEAFLPKTLFHDEESSSFFRDLTGGILFELGYYYESPLSFDGLNPTGTSKPDDALDDIQSRPAGAGSLSLSGMTFRVMLVMHF
ncbi:MAG: hypothetical protein FJ088_15460 [Deltaproteobacteria bacterium]|nr:hypothetical protein [Deltaproteobacteria bacterium]